ncbi:MAG: hypothetical protein Q8P91_00855 [bacterium]|nr:hypothetical protein [bacterium]
MSLDFSSVKLTGNPGPSGWTQIHEFSPENEEKMVKRGRLFAVVSIKLVKDGVDSVVAGRELLSRFHEEYFGSLDNSPFIALKSSLEKVIKEFSGQWQETVEIAAAAILNDVVYTAAGGGSSVDIFREGGLAKILISGQKDVVSASGYPKEGDLLILGTDSFFKAFDEGLLKASLEGPSLESFTEALAPATHAREDGGSIGVVVIKFSAQKKKDVLGKLKERVRRFRIKFPERKIYVREGFKEDVIDGGNKTTFTAGLLLLILLLVSIGFGIKQKNIRKLKSQYEPKLVQAQQEFDESYSLVNVDKQRSRELFLLSQNKVKELMAEKITDKRLLVLEEKIKEAEGSFLGIYNQEAEIYMDLSLISSGFKGDSLVFSGGNLYIFDKNGSKVSRVKTDTKKTEVVAGPEQLRDISSISAYEDDIYGLSPDGIYLLTKQREKIIEKDWEGNVSLFAYAGNIYLLNKMQSTVTRFPAVERGFAKGQNWLAPGININFSGVISTAVDGNIWFLFEPFKVLKLAQGSTQSFKIDEIPGGLNGADIIYADETTKGVYLLDKSNKRIIVLLKDGSYQALYSSEKIGETVDFAVSEEEKMIILLTGDKLHSIELKHL